MDTLAPFLTPFLVLSLFAWTILANLSDLRKELRTELRDFRKDINSHFERVNTTFDSVNARLDGVSREIADLRERMAKLDNTVGAFVGRRPDHDET